MILQAYDFRELALKHGCRLQMGGSDQWGNIVNGIELTRRMESTEVFGVTTPLLTTADGAKMGKTAAGAVWLNEDQLPARSEEHTSELQSLMRISYAVFCLKKKKKTAQHRTCMR